LLRLFSLPRRQIERKFFRGSEAPEPFLSLLDFQRNNLRNARIATLGALLVGQLRQVPGLSVAGAEAIAHKLGGTVAQLSRSLHALPPGAAQVSAAGWRVSL
jgi:hypothetical protein